MHRSKRGEPAAKSPMKRSSSSRARWCSQLSDTQGLTITGRIELREKKLGRLEYQLQEGAHQSARKSTIRWRFGQVWRRECVCEGHQDQQSGDGQRRRQGGNEGSRRIIRQPHRRCHQREISAQATDGQQLQTRRHQRGLGGDSKKLSNKIKNLERETYRLKKTVGSGASQGKRDQTLCPHCKE